MPTRASPGHSIRRCFRVGNFAGWDLPALWDEVSYHTKYVFNIKRMALFGGAKWQA
jgi:hypothetical protein